MIGKIAIITAVLAAVGAAIGAVAIAKKRRYPYYL